MFGRRQTCLGHYQSFTGGAKRPSSAELDGWIRRQMELRAIPGMQVAVVKDGRIVHSGAYGAAKLQTPVPGDRRHRLLDQFGDQELYRGRDPEAGPARRGEP